MCSIKSKWSTHQHVENQKFWKPQKMGAPIYYSKTSDLSVFKVRAQRKTNFTLLAQIFSKSFIALIPLIKSRISSMAYEQIEGEMVSRSTLVGKPNAQEALT